MVRAIPILWITPSSLVLLLFCASFAQAEQVEAIAESTESYYPLQKGNLWHYDVEVDSVPIKMTYVVAKIETIDSERLFRIDTTVDGRVQSTEHLKHSTAGLFRSRFNGIEAEPPVQMLKSPIQIGDSWKARTKIGPQEIVVEAKIEKTEKITVPAGEFEAIQAHVATDVDGIQVVSDYWFAVDVGIVKQEMVIGDQKIISKLREYKLAAPAHDPPKSQP